MTWTITKLLNRTAGYFNKLNIECPHLEAEILLAHALGLKRIELYINHERVLNQAELSRFREYVRRRGKREPVAYITNRQPFMSLDFYVDRNVLIPRPETEKLVETIIDYVKSSRIQRASLTILDTGTGCGCIAISLAKYLSNLQVIGIDSSPEAIAIAQKNARHHQVNDRCQFISGDMFMSLKNTGKFFDLIVSNPPYIPGNEIDKLEPDVKDWEPRQALDGGEDGLDCIRRLVAEAPRYLKTDGLLIIEIGFGQGEKARKLAEETGRFAGVRIIKDLNQKDRILIATILQALEKFSG